MLNTVLICGLIRKEEILKQMIEIYCKLRNEHIIHEIIIATDKNTYNNNVMKEYFIKKNIMFKEYDNLSI